ARARAATRKAQARALPLRHPFAAGRLIRYDQLESRPCRLTGAHQSGTIGKRADGPMGRCALNGGPERTVSDAVPSLAASLGADREIVELCGLLAGQRAFLTILRPIAAAGSERTLACPS